VAYSRGGSITHAYFPITAIYSTVTAGEDGAVMAGMTFGREGMVGLPACDGTESSTHHRKPLGEFVKKPLNRQEAWRHTMPSHKSSKARKNLLKNLKIVMYMAESP
jgi:hypothetical protein